MPPKPLSPTFFCNVTFHRHVSSTIFAHARQQLIIAERPPGMDDVELTSGRMGAQAYNALPQHERGMPSALPPFYSQNSGPRPHDNKNPYNHFILQSESIPDIVVSREPTYRLPPKSYHQSSKEHESGYILPTLLLSLLLWAYL